MGDVEAAEGGVFRSDNAGRTWTKVNDQAMLRQRAWYYSHIFADPQSADTVYAQNVGFFKSIDGGRSWSPIGTPHGDNHALWIAPDNPLRMIEGNDGGATVTNDGGRTLAVDQASIPVPADDEASVAPRDTFRIPSRQAVRIGAASQGRVGLSGTGEVPIFGISGKKASHIGLHGQL